MINNQEKNRILIFSMTYFPFVGGAEVAVKEITDRISDFEFDMITARLDRKLPDFEKVGNISVYRIGWGIKLDKYFYPFLAYLKAKELHLKRDYKIIKAVMAFYGGLAALFFKLKYPNVKYLLNMQSGDSDVFVWMRTWFWYPLYKMIYTKADFIQPLSHFLAERAQKYGYKKELKIIPNGVDINKFNVEYFAPEQIPELNINSDEKVIITSSRLVKKNAINDLIKAVSLIEEKIKLLIMGDGPKRKKLGRLTKKLGIADRVIFFGEYDNNVLPKYLSLADVFVRPSLSEGLGISFLEAMAIGVPVITTPVGGIPDFLRDKETGLFCEVRNPQDIADKIKYLLSDNDLRNKIINNARNLVREKYDWDKISQDMRNIYNKLI